MSEFLSTRNNSLKKTINVRELYNEKDFSSSGRNSVTIQFNFKPARCSSRLSRYRYGNSRSPLTPDLFNSSGLFIQTIQSPSELRMAFNKTMRKPVQDSSFGKIKASEGEFLRKSIINDKDDFSTKALKASKIKFSVSIAPKRPASRLIRFNRTLKKNENFELKEPLTGWE